MTILGYGSVIDRNGITFAAYRRGDEVVDLSRVEPEMFADGTLDRLLAAGPSTWSRIAHDVGDAAATHALADLRPQLGFTVADFVDFYVSLHHASNAGAIFRPDADPLPRNWKHLPLGYHGRSGSVVVSGTPVERPSGVLGPGVVGPTERLDFEAEVAFVVGRGGRRIAVDAAPEHVFGVCLLNDWSARDIQGFETVPLGPFLGKSFATSISPWITPLAALSDVQMPGPEQDPVPVPHLRATGLRQGLRIDLQVELNGTVISRPPFAEMYWTYGQMLAHLTSNGASVRPGDVYASGTVSGPRRDQRGCLLELGWNGTEPVTLNDGSSRVWLADGDTVTIRGRAGPVELAPVVGTVSATSPDVSVRVKP